SGDDTTLAEAPGRGRGASPARYPGRFLARTRSSQAPVRAAPGSAPAAAAPASCVGPRPPAGTPCKRRDGAPPTPLVALPGRRPGRLRSASACGSRSARLLDDRAPRPYSHARMIPEQSATLAVASDVALESRLAVPAGAPAGIVICHPHPLYGGDMDNPVVVRVQEVCAELGLATLRFNFRGVGGSSGTHGGGLAEQEDARGALDALAQATGERPLAVAGTADPSCPADDFRRFAARGAWVTPAVIEGADHFFFGKLYPLGEAVSGWARGWIPAGAR